MKLSIIAPPKLHHYEAITDFHLLPVHHLFEAGMRLFYRELRDRGDYIILDNGVTERGTPCGVNVLAEYALTVGAQEIVLPDVFDDGPATVDSTFTALEEFKKLSTRPLDVKLMAVVHGSTEAEWTQVYNTFVACDDIDVIGFPKVMTRTFGSRFLQLRTMFQTEVVQRSMYKEYHLLGVWASPSEVPNYKRYFPWIRSIDTSLPVMSGVFGEDISISDHFGTFRKHQLDEGLTVDPNPEATLRNIAAFLKWTEHAQGVG